MKTAGKKIAALAIAVMIVCSGIFPAEVQAAAASSEKEEVVYANLDGNGNPGGAYVVNIFKDKDITDFGDYSQVKNMNTNDTISDSDGMITIQNSADRLYYEGVLDQAELPWNIGIVYRLDGTEYSAEDIAGKSGKLELELSVQENPNAKEVFFDNYALQVTVMLDTELCKNIVNQDATQANAGKMKQLTYTLLPGNGKDIVITADVTDFEMESIAMNGIRLKLGIDSGTVDTGELQDKIADLQNAVSDLDTGANALKDGAGSLTEGASKLQEGIDTINDGLEKLSGKSSSLTSGSAEVKGALSTIQSSLRNVDITAEELSKLSEASAQIKDGIGKLVGGLGTMGDSADTYYAKLSQAGLSDLNAFVGKHNDAVSALGITDTQRALYNAYLTGGNNGVQSKLGELVQAGDAEAAQLYKKVKAGDTQAVTDYITAAGKLISIEALLKADVSYIQGSEQLIRGIDTALDNKSGNLMTAALKLQSGYDTFHSGINDLVSSLGSLAINMAALKSGIDTLASKYDTLDGGIDAYTDAVDSISKGYGQICEGALSMVSGTSDLYDGTKTLAGGTDEFVSETSGLQEEMQDQIDGMLSEFTGSDFQPVSFVSDKNTKVDSVQFVIKTAAVKKAEAVEAVQTQEEHLNLWQKFLRLFGLY